MGKIVPYRTKEVIFYEGVFFKVTSGFGSFAGIEVHVVERSSRRNLSAAG